MKDGNTTAYRLQRIAIVALLAALPAASAFPADGDDRLPVGEVVRVGNLFVMSTRHYQVETDITPETTRLVAEHMETVGAAYYNILRAYGRIRIPRFSVRVYRRKFDYLEVVGSRHVNTIGLYVKSRKTLYACVGNDNLDHILAVLRHEGWHQFIHAVIENIPPWVDEGMAEYFRFARVEGGKLILGEMPGRDIRMVRGHLRRRQIIPLEELMRIDLRTWNQTLREEPGRGSLQYRQSFTLVHFLLHGDRGRHRKLRFRYLNLLEDGVSREQARKRVFGSNLARLRKAWAAHVGKTEPSPRFICRENLSLLGDLLLKHGGGQRFTAAELGEALIKQGLGEWNTRRRFGDTIHSDNPAEIATILHCPRYEGDAAISYELRYPSPEAKLPDIICRRHRGFTLRFWHSHDDRLDRWEPHLAEEPSEKTSEEAAKRTAKEKQP